MLQKLAIFAFMVNFMFSHCEIPACTAKPRQIPLHFLLQKLMKCEPRCALP